MIALCLVLLSSAQASRQKDYNIQLEVLRYGLRAIYATHRPVGPGAELWGNLRLAGLTVSYKRLRLGVSLFDNPPPAIILNRANSILPVEAGFTIYQRPLRYGWFRGMVPDVFAEAGFYWMNEIINPFGARWKVGVRSELDYYGMGGGIEVAYFFSRRPDIYGRNDGPAASLYIRLLVTNFGF